MGNENEKLNTKAREKMSEWVWNQEKFIDIAY